MIKTKLLIIATGVPNASGKGYQVLLDHRLKTLSKQYIIHLVIVTFSSENIDEKYQLMCGSIQILKISFWRDFREILKNIIRGMPVQCAIYSSCFISSVIKSKVIEHNVSNFYSMLMRPFHLITNLDGVKVCDFVDSQTLNFQRRVDSAPLYNKYLLRLEKNRVRKYEKKLSLEEISLGITVSSIDKSYLSDQNAIVLPVPCNDESMLGRRQFNQRDGLRLVFSGNLNYAPNVEAVKWLARLKKKLDCFDDTKFEIFIVGRNSSKSLEKFCNFNALRFVGEVDNVPKYLMSCDVALAPMFSGSGMQIKILEAMSVGIPVVTTPLGYGDLKACKMTEILIGPNIQEFYSILTSISKQSLFKIGNAGKDYLMQNHSENMIGNKLLTELARHYEGVRSD